MTECVLILAVCFNALLSIANGHGVTLQRGHVAFAEIVIYAAALTIVVMNADRRMFPWFLLILFIVLNGFLLCLGNGSFNPKYMRDVLVVPTFIMLGMTYGSRTLTKPIIILQSIVLAIAILEALSPQIYSDIFQILKYYVNTRDFSEGQFWNSESTLFVSATRPGDRFFGFVNLHRVSSVFLEPVSLGNYCVVIAIFIVAYWRQLSFGAKLFLTISTMALVVGCDGRLAAVSIVIISVASFVLRYLSSRWSVFYLPIMLIFAAVLAFAFVVDPGNDNFGGRVAGSMVALFSVGFPGLLGLDADLSSQAADSGITYFVLTQSVLGVAVIWAIVCLTPVGRLYETRLYVHGIALLIPLNLLVSNSIFSIKVASIIWFAYGYFFVKDSASAAVSMRPDESMARSERVAA